MKKTMLNMVMAVLSRIFGRDTGDGSYDRGYCSACGGAAERAPNGTWWHLHPETCEDTPPGEPVRFMSRRMQPVGR